MQLEVMSDFFQSLDLTSDDDNFSRRLKEPNGANQDLGTGNHQASLARLAEDTIFKEGLMNDNLCSGIL